MFNGLFDVIKSIAMNITGKVDDPAEVFEKTYRHKQNQATLLRSAVRQNRATKEERRQLAKLEEELKSFDQSPIDIEEWESVFKFLIRLPVLIFWLVTNLSLLFLLCYFAHLPLTAILFVVPAALIFLIWIWSAEHDRFFRRATNHWNEMVEDFGKLLSKRRNKRGK